MKNNKGPLILIVVLFLSCTSNDGVDKVACRLLSFEATALHFEAYTSNSSPFFLTQFNPHFRGIELEYDGENSDRIKRINGGLMPVDSGSNSTSWILVNDIVYYEFEYESNVVETTIYQENFQERTHTNSFRIENDKIVSKQIFHFNWIVPETREYTYNYQEDTIVEFAGERLNRTFYLEDGNLMKVETIHYGNLEDIFGPPNTIISKEELVFSDYDDLPNLLKGKFYIEGAFYKAFSKNNYHKITYRNYIFNQDTQEFESVFPDHEGISRSFFFDQNPDGSNGLFTTECSNSIEN